MNESWFLIAFDFGVLDSSLVWGIVGLLFASLTLRQTYADAGILQVLFSAFSEKEKQKMARRFEKIIAWFSLIAIVVILAYVFIKLVFSFARFLGTQLGWDWLVSFSHMTHVAWLMLLGVLVVIPLTLLFINCKRSKQGNSEAENECNNGS